MTSAGMTVCKLAAGFSMTALDSFFFSVTHYRPRLLRKLFLTVVAFHVLIAVEDVLLDIAVLFGAFAVVNPHVLFCEDLASVATGKSEFSGLCTVR